MAKALFGVSTPNPLFHATCKENPVPMYPSHQSTNVNYNQDFTSLGALGASGNALFLRALAQSPANSLGEVAFRGVTGIL